MHVVLGTLAAAQTQGTARTMEAAIQLLNYAVTHPDAAVRFTKVTCAYISTVTPPT
jgi:hypothetical protein